MGLIDPNSKQISHLTVEVCGIITDRSSREISQGDRGNFSVTNQAEQLLLDMGFHQLRVRIHGDVARIELDPSEFDKFMKEEVRTEVYSRFKEYGFAYVALDIMGYRMGSMNETIL